MRLDSNVFEIKRKCFYYYGMTVLFIISPVLIVRKKKKTTHLKLKCVHQSATE